MPPSPDQPCATPAAPRRGDALAHEVVRTLTLAGAVGLGVLFCSGYLPALRDARTLADAGETLRAEIRQIRTQTAAMRAEIRAAKEDPAYAESLRRANAPRGLAGESTIPGAWRATPVGETE